MIRSADHHHCSSQVMTCLDVWWLSYGHLNFEFLRIYEGDEHSLSKKKIIKVDLVGTERARRLAMPLTRTSDAPLPAKSLASGVGRTFECSQYDFYGI